MANLKDTIVLGKLNVTDQVVADKLIKLGGTNAQILLANGEVVTKSQLVIDGGGVTSIGTSGSGSMLTGASLANNKITFTKGSFTTSIATSTGTNELTLSHGSKYSITAGGDSFIFTMPSQYSLPLATDEVRGGIKIGYEATRAKIPLKLSDEKGYVELTDAAIKDAIDNGGDLTWEATSYTFECRNGERLKLDGSLMYNNSSNVTKMVVGNTGNMGIAGYLYQYSDSSKRAPWSTAVYNIEQVSALPSSPDANTLYIII